MTNEQLEKINVLNKLYYAEMKLKSLKSLKIDDKKRAKNFIDIFPDKSDNKAFSDYKREVCSFYKKSAGNYLIALREYLDIREKTEKIIDSAEDVELCSILRYRYLEYRTWEKIAEKMYYSLRNVKYKHKAALDKIKI